MGLFTHFKVWTHLNDFLEHVLKIYLPLLQRKTTLNIEIFSEVKQLREECNLKLTVQVEPIRILKQNGEARVN